MMLKKWKKTSKGKNKDMRTLREIDDELAKSGEIIRNLSSAEQEGYHLSAKIEAEGLKLQALGEEREKAIKLEKQMENPSTRHSQPRRLNQLSFVG
jgi:hypothetical protein